MKKVLAIVLSVAILLGIFPISTFTVSADGIEYESGYYIYTVSNDKATITDCDTSISGNVTIPTTLGGYTVVSIGNSAFAWCTNLEYIEIPDSVTTIENHVFGGCESLKSITIPKSVTSIGFYVFSHCKNLTNLIVASGNKVYHSSGNCIIETATKTLVAGCKNSVIPSNGSVTRIGPYAFMGCSGLISITIPKCITEIGGSAFSGSDLTSITIPSSITSIDSWAFSGSNLKSITLLEGVTSISNRAFSGCSDLTNIIIPSSVTRIYDNAFEGCVNLTIRSSAGSYAETFAKKNNIPFKSISNIAQMVAVPDTIGADYVIYGNLKTVTEVNAVNKNGRLFLSKDEYYTVDIPSCTLTDLERLALVPTSTKSNISAVHCNGTDILANEITVLDTDSNIDLRVYSTGVTVKKYQLSTSSVSILNANVIAESTTGKFDISPSKLPADSSLFVRIVDSNNKVHKALEIKLNIEKEVNIDVDLGEILNVTVPESVPFIGGEKFEINLSDVPFSWKQEGDSLRIALGTEYSFDDKAFNYKNYRDEIEGITETLKTTKSIYNLSGFLRNHAHKKPVTILGKPDVSVMITGYAEFIKNDNGKYEYSAGTAIMGMEASYSHESQHLAWVIPIVLKSTVEVGAKACLTLKLDEEGSKLLASGNLDITLPKIRLTGGLGIKKIADISVYGEGAHNIYVDFDVPYTKASFSGELGFSAKFLMFSDKVPILNGTYEYYNSLSHTYSLRSVMTDPIEEIVTNAGNYTIDRSYLKNQSEWLSQPNISMFALDEEDYTVSETRQLQTSVYDGAAPVTAVLDDGTVFMVWTADIAQRNTGNHTAAVYSLYSPHTDSWTEPQIIQDDGTADFNPVVAQENGKVYVAWSNVNKVFETEPGMNELASACEINIAEFDFDTFEFGNSLTLTNDNDYDGNPSLVISNENVYVSWLGNTAEDILNLTGENTVEYTVIKNGVAESNKVFVSSEFPISDKNIGVINGEVAIAYIVALQDETGAQSSAVYAGNIGGEISVLSNIDAMQSGLIFAEFCSENLLFWNDGNNIVSLNSFGGEIITQIADIQNAKFSVISGIDKYAVVYASTDSETSGTDIYVNLYDGYRWSDAVKITQNDGYSENVSGYIDFNGNIRTVFTQKIVDITDDNFVETVNLCDAYVMPHYDLGVSDLDCDVKGLLPGEVMPIAFTVNNNGLYSVDTLKYEIKDSEDTILYEETRDVTLASGEMAEQSIDFVLPEVISSAQSYYLTVTPYNQEDANLLDNRGELEIGYADISLEIERITSGKAVGAILNVTNYSQNPQEVSLYLRDGSRYGAVLNVYSLGTVESGDTIQFKYDFQMLRALKSSEKLIYFEVASNDYEVRREDNVDYMHYVCEKIDSITSTNVPYYYDANEDGIFDIRDVVRLKTMLVNETNIELLSSFDIDGDTFLNALDVTCLRDEILNN